MKQLIFLTSFIIACLNLSAQNARKDASGNYVAVQSVSDSTKANKTGSTYTDSKGNVFPVYISKNQKLFIIRVSSKTGKPYNYYLKID
jgi:hypothetical protein